MVIQAGLPSLGSSEFLDEYIFGLHKNQAEDRAGGPAWLRYRLDMAGIVGSNPTRPNPKVHVFIRPLMRLYSHTLPVLAPRVFSYAIGHLERCLLHFLRKPTSSHLFIYGHLKSLP